MINAAKPKILYVDDDQDDCIFLQTSLEDAGNTSDLVWTHDGEEAVAYLNSVGADALPSLIILDLNMPRWDGKRTLKYLKSQARFAAIPVVVFSTSANETEKEACREMGALSFFKKPYHFNDYRAILANFLSVMKA